MRKLSFLCFFFTLLATANAADRWWEIRLSGEPSGYQHLTTETLPNGTIRTTDEQVITINRLGSLFVLKTKVISIESSTGELISARAEVTQSDQTVVTEAEIKPDAIQIHSTTGAGSYDRSVPNKDSFCGPTYYARLTSESLRKAGDSVKCRLYEPGSLPVRSTRTLVGEDNVGGKRVLRVMVKSGDKETGPIWLFEDNGFVFENERDLAGTKLATHATDKETALKATENTGPRNEFFDHSAAHSNVRFADARALERVTLRITHHKPDKGWPAFQGPSQRIIERTPVSLIMEISRPEIKNARSKTAAAENLEAARYLKPNQYLQSDDPEVIRLARELAGEEHDPFKAARKLQDWVAGNMTFDTGIALTPASEAVRNRRGTCGAYAVLLASMARAIGIPSRVAMGYIYAAGIWGSHAWTEVFVENQWIPLDSAGYRPGIADAGRLQFGSYTLEDNAAMFNVAALQMYGNIDIDVLEYSTGGKTFFVSPSAAKYSVSASEYRNTSLQFAVRKSAEFEFNKLDAVYPDFTILEMQRGSAKISVQLLEVFPALRTLIAINEVSPGAKPVPAKLDGRDAIVVSVAGKARLLSRDGESVWMITAEGQDADTLLAQVAGGWKWLQE
jgi:transglutaminase-like putative cysteine protease